MSFAIHHVAIICSNYQRSKDFYVNQLGFQIIAENHRAERKSWKLDLQKGTARLELFSFPAPPPRPSTPEAQGARHIAFAVTSVAAEVAKLHQAGVITEDIRTDPYTGAAYVFFADPDGLPLELYEIASEPVRSVIQKNGQGAPK